jgi:hypothetical protein
MSDPITAQDIYKIIKITIGYPSPKVCKHYACLPLLELLESRGHNLDVNLVKAIVDADDTKINEILEKIGL